MRKNDKMKYDVSKVMYHNIPLLEVDTEKFTTEQESQEFIDFIYDTIYSFATDWDDADFFDTIGKSFWEKLIDKDTGLKLESEHPPEWSMRKLGRQEEWSKLDEGESITIKDKVYQILSSFKIAHLGWDTDIQAWIAKSSDDNNVVILTNHGSFYIGSKNELQEKIKEYKKWIEETQRAIELLEQTYNPIDKA